MNLTDIQKDNPSPHHQNKTPLKLTVLDSYNNYVYGIEGKNSRRKERHQAHEEMEKGEIDLQRQPKRKRGDRITQH